MIQDKHNHYGGHTSKINNNSNTNSFAIYFITGYDRSSIESKYMNLVNGYVQKPIRLHVLQGIVNTVIANKQQRMQQQQQNKK